MPFKRRDCGSIAAPALQWDQYALYFRLPILQSASRAAEESNARMPKRTLFLNPPSYESFDGRRQLPLARHARDRVLLVPGLALLPRWNDS